METLLRNKVRRFMVQNGWRGPATIVAGVSGGVDSTVLLHLLRDLSDEMEFVIIAAHLNHCLRGKEAERDEEFVRKTAEAWGLKVEIGSVDVRECARREGLSIQVAARKARYAFFERVMKKFDAKWIALGHHADDVAETVMMRFIRGASVEGLRGIPLERGRTIRPLWPVTRDEIVAYAGKQGVLFVEDRSNREDKYLRNRIRHHLIPEISRDYQPAISEHLRRYARYFTEIHDLLSRACREAAPRILDERGWIRLGPFRKLHPALRRVFLERFLLDGGWTAAPLSFEQLEKVMALAGRSAGTQRYAIGKGRWIVREYDRLFVTDAPAPPPIRTVTCPVPGSVDLTEIGNRLTVEVAKGSPRSFPDGRREVCLDGDKIGSYLWIRSFRPGDRIVTTGEIKVKKLFIDRKIPARLRPAIPLVGAGEEIAWVGGVEVNRRFHVTEKTRRVLRLRFSRPVRTA